MAVVPSTIVGKIEFYETHLAVWSADPPAIGIEAVQIADLAARTAAARADYEAALVARNAARSATINQADTVGSMQDLGGDMIKAIRTHAELTGDPSVYAAADIPAPSPPTPVGKPAAPADVTAAINANGHGEIEWKGNRTGGTFYVVERQMTPISGSAGAWTYAGSSAENTYTDTAIPVGFKAVAYRVYASRPAGNSAPTTANPIYFGTAAAGDASASGGLSIAA